MSIQILKINKDSKMLALTTGSSIALASDLGNIYEYKAMAIYSDSDNSFSFYAIPRKEDFPEVGSAYNNKVVTNVYTGFDTETWSSASNVLWYSIRTSITKVVIDNSFKNIQPVSLAYWFYTMRNTEFEGLENIDTSNVTTLRSTLYECSGFVNADGLSRWDTSKVTTLQNIFYYCSNIANVNGLSRWNTSNVATLYNTFYECGNLTTIDISGWNTANVTDMQNMFYSCSSLETIYSDDNNFVTTAVTSGSYMFFNCSKLVGGNGTYYSSTESNYTMAHVDTESNPGYFTAK